MIESFKGPALLAPGNKQFFLDSCETSSFDEFAYCGFHKILIFMPGLHYSCQGSWG